MKKNLLTILCLVCNVVVFAQQKMYIHKSDHVTLGATLADVNEMTYSTDGISAYFSIGTQTAQYGVAEIDSITFGANTNTVAITYNGSSVSVVNPYAFEGVSVTVNGSDVTVNTTTDIRDINYSLSGTTTDGMFKLYSDKRFYLTLNGVSITNPNGAAINIQSNNKAFVTLADGTVNTLTDGATYATAVLDATGVAEDEKGTFFSEGKLEFLGNGSLTVTGLGKQGICSDGEIDMNSGTITVAAAAKDGVHAKNGFKIAGGTLKVTATGDAIDGDEGHAKIYGGSVTTINTAADVTGIKCDSTLTVSGGTLTMTVSGAQSKGLKAGLGMVLSGGTIGITASGAAVLVSANPAYCTAIKCDAAISISGANITITHSGAGGKGISAGTDINMTSGTVTVTVTGAGAKYTNSSSVADSYNASCVTADGNISLIGGTLTATTGSAASGGKAISADGALTIGDAGNSPVIKLTTAGAKFLVSGTDYSHPKTIVTTGAINVNNGSVTCSSTDDGIHSETSFTQNGGNVVVTTSTEGIESKLITFNAGTANVTASNDGLNGTMGTTSGGTESTDASYIYFKGGTIAVNCTAGDAIDGNGNIVMTGGTVIANGPQSGVEEAADFNGTFVVKGGYFIGIGSNSNMTKALSTSSTQRSFYLTSSALISSSTLFHIQNAAGTDLVTFLPKYGGYKILFSSPEMLTTSTYSIYTGGSCTGTATYGLYSGGSYSGGTAKKTAVSLSTTSTVTTLSF